MKKSNDTIGDRTRDLPACSALPQPTAPPCAPYNTCTNVNYSTHKYIQLPLNTFTWISTSFLCSNIIRIYTERFLVFYYTKYLLAQNGMKLRTQTTQFHELCATKQIHGQFHAAFISIQKNHNELVVLVA